MHRSVASHCSRAHASHGAVRRFVQSRRCFRMSIRHLNVITMSISRRIQLITVQVAMQVSQSQQWTRTTARALQCFCLSSLQARSTSTAVTCATRHP